MHTFRLMAALAACTLILAVRLAQGDDTIVEADRVTAALKSMIDDGSAAGASALIWEDGEEAYFGAFGQADIEARRPMTRDTLVQIFSMTKPITGVALLQLLEQDAFDLDDPVAKHLPEFAGVRVYEGDDDGEPILVPPRRPPTIRDLTRHTAGLANGGESGPYLEERYREADPMNLGHTLADTSKALAGIPLAYHPGERWLYSDAVDVQARLVERLSGQVFADYIREHILDPLGMDDTAYLVPKHDRNRVAAVYGPTESGELERLGEPTLVTEPHALTPGGWGLASTLDDYMRFARMLLNGGELEGVRILAPESVRLMATDQLPEGITETSWLPGKGQVGFGIDVAVRIAPPATPEENRGAVGEFFWDGLASTLFWVDPKNDLAAVFFIQRIPFFGEAHTRFREAVYGPPTP